MSATMNLTLYLVGYNRIDAKLRFFPFDSIESAESFQRDNPGTKVFEVVAVVDFSTMREVQ